MNIGILFKGKTVNNFLKYDNVSKFKKDPVKLVLELDYRSRITNPTENNT